MEEQQAGTRVGGSGRHSRDLAARVSAALSDPEFAELMARFWSERYDEQSRMVKRGMAARAAAGGTVGLAPLGYVNRRQGDRTWIEVDPVAGPLVKEAFEMAASRKTSVRNICDALTEKGLRTKRGNPVSPSVMHGILTNPYYAGAGWAGKARRGSQPVLVDPPLFGRVQELLSKRRRRSLPVTGSFPSRGITDTLEPATEQP